MSTTSRGLSRWITGAVGALAVAALSMTAFAPAASANTDTPSAPSPANIDATQNGKSSIVVHKHEQPAQSGQPATGADQGVLANPIAGVDFTLYQLGGIDLTNGSGWTTVDALNTAISGGAVPVPNVGNTSVTVGGAGTFSLTAKGTQTTNASGIATFGSLPFGVYLAIEGNGPASITTKAAPFLVSLPFASADNTWNYNVHVYPKNSSTTSTKTATTDPAVGDQITWTVTGHVPYLGTQTLTAFKVTDQLDPALSYIANSAVVTLTGPGNPGTAITLPTGSYTFTENSGALNLTFTPAGLAVLSGTNAQGGTVTLTYTTKVTSLPSNGTIPNSATVFVNDGKSTANTEAQLGQLKIFKYAASGDQKNALQGAEFKLYVDANKTTPVQVNGTDWVGTSATDGTIITPSLKPGTYYLVETKAPLGYEQLTNPIQVTVVAGQTNGVDVNYAAVKNTQVPVWKLPLTGGNGTLTFMGAGIALLVIAGGAAVVVSRRKAAAAA